MGFTCHKGEEAELGLSCHKGEEAELGFPCHKGEMAELGLSCHKENRTELIFNVTKGRGLSWPAGQCVHVLVQPTSTVASNPAPPISCSSRGQRCCWFVCGHRGVTCSSAVRSTTSQILQH